MSYYIIFKSFHLVLCRFKRFSEHFVYGRYWSHVSYPYKTLGHVLNYCSKIIMPLLVQVLSFVSVLLVIKTYLRYVSSEIKLQRRRQKVQQLGYIPIHSRLQSCRHNVQSQFTSVLCSGHIPAFWKGVEVSVLEFTASNDGLLPQQPTAQAGSRR